MMGGLVCLDGNRMCEGFVFSCLKVSIDACGMLGIEIYALV